MKDACTNIKVYKKKLLFEDPTNPRFGDAFKLLFEVVPEDVNWNNPYLLTLLEEQPQFDLKFQVLTANVLDARASFSKLVKKDYAAIVIDTIYAMDHDPAPTDAEGDGGSPQPPTTVDDLRKMLHAFKDLNLTSDQQDYTAFVFCSFLQVCLLCN